jgi:aryl-alcohol dehydrogenase-like predicted oxidoreductase
MSELIPGYATPDATQAYAEAAGLAEGHYQAYGPKPRLHLSSIGLGTYRGAADDATDAAYREALAHGLRHGLNVVDTGAHFRFGRSPKAAGAAVRDAVAAGVPREAMFLVAKGGFVTFPDGVPEDPEQWFKDNILRKGLGDPGDLAAGCHLLSPAYIAAQLEQCRRDLGVETLDCFIVDQPEIHIPEIGKEAVNDKLGQIYRVLEMAVQAGRLRSYGLATNKSWRVATDDDLFLSLTGQLGLAEKAAGYGDHPHHFTTLQMPYNAAQLEGFTRFNQATGQGNVASTLQAAFQLDLYVMGTHALRGGALVDEQPAILRQVMRELPGPAERALQFARSTPGIGTALVSGERSDYVDGALAVARAEPLDKETFVRMFEKAEDEAADREAADD